MNNLHLYNGELVDSIDLDQLEDRVLERSGKALSTDILFNACEILESKIRCGNAELESLLINDGMSPKEANECVIGISRAFSKRYLQQKLMHELGSVNPFTLRRPNMEENIIEGYYPLGILCHVAAGNSAGLGALSVLEGAMCGNINIIKLSSKESGFSLMLLKMLVECDTTNNLKDYVYALSLPSSDSDTLKRLFDFSSAIVAWGGVSAMDSIKAMTSTPVIEWGHHISFGYLTKNGLSDKNFLGLAQDICLENQQACSSPQCLFFEGEYSELKEVAQRLFAALKEVSPTIELAPMSINERAQITSSNLMVEYGSCLDESQLIVAEDNSFRIYISRSSTLEPSPLYRTIWLKPIKRDSIVRMLQPMSRFLQTVSLGCSLEELYELTTLFAGCGVTRIVECGSVFSSYPGEPHDGVFALTKYCKRISVVSSLMGEIASMNQIKPYEPIIPPNRPIMNKSDFIAMKADDDLCKLYVKSGGSSGKTLLSPYSYNDYHFQMSSAAQTLLAVGLDPKRDRIMNLFSCGHLYGGFISFGAILEFANAKHYPMAENPDYTDVTNHIIELGIDVIMGMPSYILNLFRSNREAFAKYKGVKKIYYGGEFMAPDDAESLKIDFGVEIISSVFYGSNDVGPMGYGCQYCEPGVHHLLSTVIDLEIVKVDCDEPVDEGEIGRLIFTPKFREGHSVARYEIGDLGCWVKGTCRCGRVEPRYQLKGRYGDIFRIGGDFFNYNKIESIIRDKLNSTPIQIVLKNGTPEIIELRVAKEFSFSQEQIIDCLRDNYEDMNTAINLGILELEVNYLDISQMQYAANSGKLLHIIESRLK